MEWKNSSMHHRGSVPERSYVVIDSSGVKIDRGIVIPRKEADFNEIKTVKTVGNDLRIGLHTGKVFRVRMNHLSSDDAILRFFLYNE